MMAIKAMVNKSKSNRTNKKIRQNRVVNQKRDVMKSPNPIKNEKILIRKITGTKSSRMGQNKETVIAVISLTGNRKRI